MIHADILTLCQHLMQIQRVCTKFFLQGSAAILLWYQRKTKHSYLVFNAIIFQSCRIALLVEVICAGCFMSLYIGGLSCVVTVVYLFYS